MDRISLSRQNWKDLEQFFGQNLMSLEEFSALYPGLTRKQLARVAGCSVDVVNLWYTESDRHRKPTDAHRLRFELAHWLWTQDRASPGIFEELREARREQTD